MFAARNMMFSGVDPIAALVAEFVARTGATSTTGLYSLAEYVVAQSLWSNFVIYPMKSAQNVGSGSTVEPFGGLTTNDMTLVNSPTWGAGGIAFASASSHHAKIADFIGSQEITIFHRTVAVATSGAALISKWEAIGDLRSFTVGESYSTVDAVIVARSSDGTASASSHYETSASTFPTVDTCFVVNWKQSDSRSLYFNKTQQSITLIPTRNPQTTTFDSGCDISINSNLSGNSPSFIGNQTVRASAFVIGVSLTTTQRETITDLINAL